jgi:type IV pilus assembly protein PilV
LNDLLDATRAKPVRTSAPDRLGGFSLVEAMVSLVVLSVGMIGIAALHGQGLSASNTAQFRSLAVNLTADMADRIRVNRLGQADYGGAAADRDCDAGGIDCTAAQMAQHDLFVWSRQVQQMLPNGQGLVQFNAGTMPPSFTIGVSWDEVGEGTVTHEIVVRVPEI